MAAGLLLAGGVIGALLGRQWPASESATPMATADGSGWVQRAAYAHGVYVPEPRHAVEVKAQEEHLARWLTRRIAVPVKLFDLREFGFELVGGRLLPDGAGKSAQLMYQDAQGTRITVYLRKPDEGTDAAFRYERQGDVGLFYWVESGAGYALVGALPKEQLLALAQSIYRQHPVAGAAQASAALEIERGGSVRLGPLRDSRRAPYPGAFRYQRFHLSPRRSPREPTDNSAHASLSRTTVANRCPLQPISRADAAHVRVGRSGPRRCGQRRGPAPRHSKASSTTRFVDKRSSRSCDDSCIPHAATA